MVENDQSYFQRRAEAELKQAEQATEPGVTGVHYQLAEAYLAKMSSADFRLQRKG